MRCVSFLGAEIDSRTGERSSETARPDISGWPADAGWLPSRTSQPLPPLFEWPWSWSWPARHRNRRTHRLAHWLSVSQAVRRYA